LCGIIIGKKPTNHHHHTGMITFQATSRQPRKLIFGMQPYSNPTRRNMGDDLNIFGNGRRPQVFLKEDNLNFFENGRRLQNKNWNQNN
jgi:ribosomal protein L13